MAVKRVKAHFGPEAKLRSQRGSFAERAPPSQEHCIGTHIEMGAITNSLNIWHAATHRRSVCVVNIKYLRPAYLATQLKVFEGGCRGKVKNGGDGDGC